MKLDDHFKEFIGNISLNSSREERISNAISAWKNNFKSDEEIKPRFVEFYEQGSYATKTAVRPQNSNEFDVDVVLVVELDNQTTPKSALQWLGDRMKQKEAYKDKIKVRDRCVRVNYAGDFHLDVVLAKPYEGDSILIPSKREDSWVVTNPKGFKKWCSKVQAESNGKFIVVTKILKYWRDIKVGTETAPKSILLTTLIGNHVVGKNSVAESLVETLKSLVDNIDSAIQDDGAVYVENPSQPDENLARDWDIDKFTVFKNKLTKLKNDAVAALDEPDKEESIKL